MFPVFKNKTTLNSVTASVIPPVPPLFQVLVFRYAGDTFCTMYLRTSVWSNGAVPIFEDEYGAENPNVS